MNRIDELIVFHALHEEHLMKIVDLMVARVSKRVKEHGIEIEVTEAAKKVLVKEGLDPTFGARPLRRAIQKLVEDSLSEELLAGKFVPGNTVIVDAEDDGKVVFRKKGVEVPAGR
jgi:ATP-dependent Clp protease ATP-binding subunit ClpC